MQTTDSKFSTVHATSSMCINENLNEKLFPEIYFKTGLLLFVLRFYMFQMQIRQNVNKRMKCICHSEAR